MVRPNADLIKPSGKVTVKIQTQQNVNAVSMSFRWSNEIDYCVEHANFEKRQILSAIDQIGWGPYRADYPWLNSLNVGEGQQGQAHPVQT